MKAREEGVIYMKGECLSAVINAANLAVEGMDGWTIRLQSAKWKMIGIIFCQSNKFSKNNLTAYSCKKAFIRDLCT